MTTESVPLTTAPESLSAGAPGVATVREARERRRRRAKALRRAMLAVLLLAAAIAVGLSLRPEPALVDVAPVTVGLLEVAVEESGRTRVKDRFTVSAPAAGRLARIALEPGDLVKEGDTMAEISPAPSPLLDARSRAEADARLGAALSALGQARTQAARAVTRKRQAERDLDRARILAKSGALPAEQLEEAEFTLELQTDEVASADFAVKVATEEVRIARAAVSARDVDPESRHIDVIAPVSGRVLRVHRESAGLVDAGAPLVEIGDPGALEAVVDLLTTDAVQVQVGTPVVIQGWGGEPIQGRVTEIEPSAFTRPSALGVDEQRVNVVVAFTAPRESWARLGDGYHVEARIILWRGDRVLKVPTGAVFRQGNGWAAFELDGEEARLIPVVVSHRGEAEVEITSGLEVGDTVIVYPGDRVKEGTEVEVRR